MTRGKTVRISNIQSCNSKTCLSAVTPKMQWPIGDQRADDRMIVGSAALFEHRFMIISTNITATVSRPSGAIQIL